MCFLHFTDLDYCKSIVYYLHVQSPANRFVSFNSVNNDSHYLHMYMLMQHTIIDTM